MSDHDETYDAPKYSNGTAAGHKGHSREARENSRCAAEKVSKSLGPRHRQMIAAWTPYGASGAIPEQIADDEGLPIHIVRPRAGELVRSGQLFELGKRPGLMGSKVMAYSTVKPNGRGGGPFGTGLSR